MFSGDFEGEPGLSRSRCTSCFREIHIDYSSYSDIADENGNYRYLYGTKKAIIVEVNVERTHLDLNSSLVNPAE